MVIPLEKHHDYSCKKCRTSVIIVLPARLGNECRRLAQCPALGLISHALFSSVPIDFPRLISLTERRNATRPQSMNSATRMEQLQ